MDELQQILGDLEALKGELESNSDDPDRAADMAPL
jgi:hypothetical protein